MNALFLIKELGKMKISGLQTENNIYLSNRWQQSEHNEAVLHSCVSSFCSLILTRPSYLLKEHHWAGLHLVLLENFRSCCHCKLCVGQIKSNFLQQLGFLTFQTLKNKNIKTKSTDIAEYNLNVCKILTEEENSRQKTRWLRGYGHWRTALQSLQSPDVQLPDHCDASATGWFHLLISYLEDKQTAQILPQNKLLSQNEMSWGEQVMVW